MTTASPARVGLRTAAQPALGLAGLLLVVPLAALIAVGAGGADSSVVVLGPLATFALPAIALVGFWWENWPGSRLRPGWSGLLDTVLITLAAVLLTMLGQSLVGDLDLRGIFDPAAGPEHSATFPMTMPLGGAAFVAMLQLTLVSEGWPLRRLGGFAGGVAALAASWGVALLLTSVGGADLGALLVLIGAWQVWFFVVWLGWPFADVRRRWLRLVSANAVVIGGAWLTYAAVHGSVSAATVTAVAGVFIAAGLIAGMLFEGALRSRVVTLGTTLLLSAALYGALAAYAASVEWTRATAAEWIAHAGLNAIGVAVILHVAIGRRFPFAAGQPG